MRLRKTVFGDLYESEAQISLWICAVSSFTLLSAFWKSNLDSLRAKLQFSCLPVKPRRLVCDWLRRKPRWQGSHMVASYISVASSTALGQILQAQQIMIFKKKWGSYSSDMLTGVTSFGCALHRLIHKSFVSTAHRAGEWQRLRFSGCRPMAWPCTNSSFAWLGHRNKWLLGMINFAFMHLSIVTTAPTPSPGECRGLWFCVGNSPWWGKLTGKTMRILTRILLLYCTAIVAYVYQTPTFPQCKSKITAHLPSASCPA